MTAPVYEPNPIESEFSPALPVTPLAELPVPLSTEGGPNLNVKHVLHTRNLAEWDFLLAAYEGVRELYAVGAIRQHERESNENFTRRLKDLYGFNYTQSIVDLFNYYLFKKPVKRDVKTLKDHELWQRFIEDCDLQGTALDEFLIEAMRYASILGHVGVVVDNSSEPYASKAEQVEAASYPYFAIYLPQDILDWRVVRLKSGRRQLAYLKLREDDGTFRLWWPDHWERWRQADSMSAAGTSIGAAEKIEEAAHPLGEIPFVWLFNIRPRQWPIGKSDITDVARIDRSIVNNLSEGEEMVYFAAFPMLLMPARESVAGGAGADDEDPEVGPTSVLRYDPEHPEAKPQWLEARISEPLNALLAWILRKVTEIYRASNAGGMAAMEIATAPKSGAALQAEFQMLNAKLCQKAVNIERAERQLLCFWLRWMGLEDQYYKDLSIERSRSYDVQNLAADLEANLTSMAIVHSRLFKTAVEKATARMMLPAASPDDLAAIDDEIDGYREYEAMPKGDVQFEYTEQQEMALEQQRLEVDKLGTEAETASTSASKTASSLAPSPFGTASDATASTTTEPYEEEGAEEEEEA